MKEAFYNEPGDILWLKSTHLRGRYAPPFKSFILVGNEDCPERLELFSTHAPDHDSPYFEINLKDES